jgi:pimeloyl-ACP methyl ester carboxylesterase
LEIVEPHREDGAVLLVKADLTLRVVAYHHRGHGNSMRVQTASIGRLADDLTAVVAQAVPDGPIVFCGHFLGGMTLMALPQSHAALVAQRAAAVAFVATSAGDPLGSIRRIPGAERAMKATLRRTARIKMPGKSSCCGKSHGARRQISRDATR